MAIILAIAGSPRRDGNSDRLLQRFVTGAEAAGASVERIVASKSGIEPCRGCNACSLTGECVIRDSMHDLYDAIDRADAFVVSTPVYFATVPAVLKIFYDRLQPYWARRHVLGLPAPEPRPGMLLVVGGGGDPYGASCAVTATRSALSVLGVHVDDVLELPGVDSPSDIGRHPDALERAERMGEALVAALP
jgi:multimeric flavodoxin WrbA